MGSTNKVVSDLQLAVPEVMQAWVLCDSDQLITTTKPVPRPSKAKVLVRINAVAICTTDLVIIHQGTPALTDGELPFKKNFTIGHECMGTIVALGEGIDEYKVGERVTVEIHAGCGQCKRCRLSLHTSCHNYGNPAKGLRASGFTKDGGCAEYAVDHVNTFVRVPDDMSDEVATLVVMAGTSMYGLTELGGLVVRKSVIVSGPGKIGFLAVAVAKSLGSSGGILTGTPDSRLPT